MTVLLKGPPPIYEVAKLKINGAVEVYALLWESAYKDIRIDQRTKLPKNERRDCGGTSEWSIKGLADVLGLGKEKVRKAIKALLTQGLSALMVYCLLTKVQRSVYLGLHILVNLKQERQLLRSWALSFLTSKFATIKLNLINTTLQILNIETLIG